MLCVSHWRGVAIYSASTRAENCGRRQQARDYHADVNPGETDQMGSHKTPEWRKLITRGQVRNNAALKARRQDKAPYSVCTHQRRKKRLLATAITVDKRTSCWRSVESICGRK